jgi:hypothetical protein
MKCVIRRNGLYLSLQGMDCIAGNWTHHLDIARVFHTQREAIEFLAASDLPTAEGQIIQISKQTKAERVKAIRREINRGTKWPA